MGSIDESVDCLSEKDVGITQYASQHEGFFGIIKQRYSDFLVNEIAANGQEHQLTDITTIPAPPVFEVSAADQTPEEEEDDIVAPDGITEEIDQQLQKLSEDMVAKRAQKDSVSVDVTALNKVQRKAIHYFLQKKYKGLVSTTADQGINKVIIVTIGSAVCLQREQKRRAPRAPKLFTKFLLYKENMDTMEAASRIASKLRIRTQDVGYCGTKDKRGKTVQLASISKIPPSRIAEAAQFISRVTVGNFSFSPQGVALGQHAGNAFSIVLREVKGSDEVIRHAVSSVKEHGVVNYYGMQRFGTHAGHTHTVGRHMLAREWDKVIRTILSPRSSDPGDDKASILRAWQSGELSAADALDRMRSDRFLSGGVEAQLLTGILARGDTDKIGALMHIPRNIRTLYLHAYQAFLWNKVVSKRLEKHGLKVLPGDLVPAKSSTTTADLESCAEDDMETETTDGSASTATADSGTVPAGDTKGAAKTQRMHSCVRPLSAEEVDAVDITQVVIPAVGYAVRMSENEMDQWYTDMLNEDGITIKHFDHPQKAFAVSGAYRPLMLRPKNFQSRICNYTDPLKPLVFSDLDRLNGLHDECEEKPETTKPLVERTDVTVKVDVGSCNNVNEEKMDTLSETVNAEETSTTAENGTNHQVENSSEVSGTKNTDDDFSADAPAEDSNVAALETSDGAGSNATADENDVQSADVSEQKLETETTFAPKAEIDSSKDEQVAPMKAVVLQFSLPPAAYATMVLRELMKMDTAAQFHASLNSSRPAGNGEVRKHREPNDGYNRGGYRGSRDGYRGSRDGYRGNRGGHRGNRGGYRGDRGGHRGSRGGYRGGRKDFASGRGDKRQFNEPHHDSADKRFKGNNAVNE